MADTSASVGVSSIVSRNAARGAIADALRLYVGRGRRYTVKQLAHGTGVKDRVIENAMADPDRDDARPIPPEALLSIARFLGPEFTAEWLRAADQGAYWLPEADDTPPGVLVADMADSAAAVSRAASDGKFDRDDEHRLRPVGRHLMAIGARFAHGGQRAASL